MRRVRIVVIDDDKSRVAQEQFPGVGSIVREHKKCTVAKLTARQLDRGLVVLHRENGTGAKHGQIVAAPQMNGYRVGSGTYPRLDFLASGSERLDQGYFTSQFILNFADYRRVLPVAFDIDDP